MRDHRRDTNQISERVRELRIAYINRVRELALVAHDVEVEPEIPKEWERAWMMRRATRTRLTTYTTASRAICQEVSVNDSRSRAQSR